MHYLRVTSLRTSTFTWVPGRHALDENSLVTLRRLDGKIFNTRQLADAARPVDQLESGGGAASPMPVNRS
jgi:hypothetical protein